MQKSNPPIIIERKLYHKKMPQQFGIAVLTRFRSIFNSIQAERIVREVDLRAAAKRSIEAILNASR